MPFVIKRLDATQIPERSAMLFLGKRNSGKTTAAVHILQSPQFQYHRVCVWAGTTPGVEFWSDVLGSSATVKRPDIEGEEYANNLLRSQPTILKSQENQHVSGLVMIFDDITSDKWFCRKSGVLTKLFTQGRHYGVTVVVCCQYLKQLPPVIRDNVDFFFVLSVPKKSIRILFNDYFEYPDTVEQLFSILRTIGSLKDKVTGEKQFACMVYNNTGARDKIELITCYQKQQTVPLSHSLGGLQRQYVHQHFRGSLRKRITTQQMKLTSFAVEEPLVAYDCFHTPIEHTSEEHEAFSN